MGAGPHRDPGAIDDGGKIVRMGTLHLERDDRPLILGGADDAERVDLAQPLMGVGGQFVFVGPDPRLADRIDVVDGGAKPDRLDDAAVQRRREMIREVFQDRVTYGQPPHRFEAGTPAIVQAIGLGAAIDYINSIGKARIRAHGNKLSAYAHERLREINSLRIIGTAKDKGAIVSFEMKGAHPHDFATIIDRAGIAVRAGTHCAMPLMERFGVAATCRASFALYNTLDEVDGLVRALTKAQEFFGMSYQTAPEPATIARVVHDGRRRRGEQTTRLGKRQFKLGDRVRSLTPVRNDGTYPHRDIGEVVVQCGDAGVVRDTWSFLGEFYYTVEFAARAAVVIMRGREMERGRSR